MEFWERKSPKERLSAQSMANLRRVLGIEWAKMRKKRGNDLLISNKTILPSEKKKIVYKHNVDVNASCNLKCEWGKRELV